MMGVERAASLLGQGEGEGEGGEGKARRRGKGRAGWREWVE